MSAKSRSYIFAASAGSSGITFWRSAPTPPSYQMPRGKWFSSAKPGSATESKRKKVAIVFMFVSARLRGSLHRRLGDDALKIVDDPFDARVISGEIRLAKLFLLLRLFRKMRIEHAEDPCLHPVSLVVLIADAGGERPVVHLRRGQPLLPQGAIQPQAVLEGFLRDPLVKLVHALPLDLAGVVERLHVGV